VTELEKKLAAFVGSKHAIACANGTDALTLSLMAAGVGPGDEVIMPAFSFFATAEAPMLVGATPIFADIDPRTYLLTVKDIEAAATSKTKAIIPVSLFGQCPDLEQIQKFADQRGIVVIEDAAQSFGAKRGNKRSGAFSNFGTTSFFPSKPLACFGDGGAIFTSDDKYAEILKQIRVHGQAGRYHHVRVGLNSRLDTLQATILLAKLEVFEEELLLRDQIATRYTQALKDSVQTPVIEKGNTCAWAQYTIEVPNRDRFASLMTEKGVPTAVHYPSTLDQQPAVLERGYRTTRPLTHSKAASQKVISLPMHPYVSAQDEARVIEAVRWASRQLK
jgi:UDP-2-acetamido-2-deoxy-ribo-hexuluronate aminotransferase